VVTSLFDFVFGAGANFLLLIVSLFPTMAIPDDFIKLPQAVVDTLAVLNYFVPVSDLVFILGIWTLAVLFLNVACTVTSFASSVRK